jgi:hypothetical protein
MEFKIKVNEKDSSIKLMLVVGMSYNFGSIKFFYTQKDMINYII